jgi:hypothetical protein
MPRYSPNTIITAIEALDFTTHAAIEKFLLRFAIEEADSPGGLEPRTLSIMKYLINNPDKKTPSGTNLVFEIIQLALEKYSMHAYSNYFPNKPTIYLKLVNLLKHDGFIVEDDRIKPLLPETVNLPEQENHLIELLNKFGFSMTIGHYEQATSAFARGDWAAANGQIRTFFESLLNSIAEKVISEKLSAETSGYKKWEYLAKTSPPFLIPNLNEWDVGNKGGFIQGLWKRLHPTGAHPGLSDEEDCSFRMHLVIIVSAYLLNRLNARMTQS